MALRDLKNNVAVSKSILPQLMATSVTGSTIDMQGFDSLVVEIVAGAWTDGTHTFSVLESDDDSTYSAVADADLDGTEPVVDGATDDDQVYLLGYKGTKRYVKVLNTVTGSPGTGLLAAANGIKGHAHSRPTN